MKMRKDRYNTFTMLSSFAKDPKEAATFKFPEFQKVESPENAVLNVPAVEGFANFDPNRSATPVDPKPVVRNVVFSDLKPVQPE